MSSHIAASISFHLTEKPFVMCHDYGTNRTPILAVQDTHAALALAARDDLAPAEHLRFARELMAAVSAYAAAVETYTAASAAQLT
ncbi:hypothetical protein OHA61_27265 [Streptomyces sp. NBC_00885]|uniref:hypothetical protein n=1 Tax=Streptomyces sp. NBC_00885 TaxID=2975857 RepID=UPI00386F9B3E|nr:hypothetical protein OHA61_27265 [Streptomyces sp. NBC_00885]